MKLAAPFVAMWLALAPTLAASEVEPPWNWGTEKSDVTNDPEFAASKAICRKLGTPQPPKSDQPTPGEAKAMHGCNAFDLYYGFGKKADYKRARLCAMTETGQETVLMQVYANGLGVRRNLDLAMAYACEIEEAPFENEAVINDLQSLKTKLRKFDSCNDVTSGLKAGFCTSLESQREGAVRAAKLKAIEAQLSPTAQSLYISTKTAFDRFVRAHDGEVDLSSTMRGALEIEEEDARRDQFLKDLKGLLAQRWPRMVATNPKSTDADLNAAYRRAITWARQKDNITTIKPGDIEKAQRAWLAYRDAFLLFTSQVAPNLGADAVVAALTSERTAQLKELYSVD